MTSHTHTIPNARTISDLFFYNFGEINKGQSIMGTMDTAPIFTSHTRKLLVVIVADSANLPFMLQLNA